MASVNDWAAKVAKRIVDDDTLPDCSVATAERFEERVAAIIATFAEPLVALLREAKREHFQACDALLNYDDEGDRQFDNPCTCGADAWNVRVDAALTGEK